MRDQLVQPCEEGLELVLDGGGHLGIGDQLHVLQFVLFCHGHFRAMGDELLGLDLPEIIAVVGES
jgi:hypothetical protein